jgi:hypothetical protein
MPALRANSDWGGGGKGVQDRGRILSSQITIGSPVTEFLGSKLVTSGESPVTTFYLRYLHLGMNEVTQYHVSVALGRSL